MPFASCSVEATCFPAVAREKNWRWLPLPLTKGRLVTTMSRSIPEPAGI